MEQNQLSTQSRSGSPFFLGYFLQRVDNPKRVQFIYASDEMKEIQERNWGAIDASLSFLDDQVEGVVSIVGSSNGFLLCCTEEYVNMHYIICNPVTREWKTLPEPHKSYDYAPLAFICTCTGAEDNSLDGITYEIFRAGVSNPRELSTTLELEIFSSLTGEWKESSIIANAPFLLNVANLQAFMFGDVIWWDGMGHKMVAYDRGKESLQVLDLPWKNDDMHLGLSDGKIHYARIDRIGNECYIEIWVLEDHRTFESESGWAMKHRFSVTTICQENPQVRIQRDHGFFVYYVRVEGFHPLNTQLVLLLLNLSGKPYWFDLQSYRLKEVNGYRQSCCYYFPYQRPRSTSHLA